MYTHFGQFFLFGGRTVKRLCIIASIVFLTAALIACEQRDLFTEIQNRAYIKPNAIAGLDVWFAENISYSGTLTAEKWTDNVTGVVLDNTQSAFYPNVIFLTDGTPLICFTASTNLEFNGTWGKVISQPYTVFAVMRATGICDAVFTGTGFNFYRGSGANTLFFDAGTALSWDAGTAIQNLSVYCFCIQSGYIDIYRNGEYQSRLSGIGSGSISSLSFGGVNDHNFDIGEFIIYSRILTDDERYKVTEYLLKRFAI